MLAQRYHVARNRVDGWIIAENLSQVGVELADPALKEYATRLAARAVMRRALRLVGPIRPAQKRILEAMEEPYQGELELERTFENIACKEFPDRKDWVMSRREDRHQQIVLMLDASLSMSGQNLALAAVAVAVLTLKLRPGDVAVVAFESTARTICRLQEKRSPLAVVEGVLSQSARGFTNLEQALEQGHRELSRARSARRAALLITDGVYTVGDDPTPIAARFPRLHVLLTEDCKTNEELCFRMAQAGQGDVHRVRRFEDLPACMLNILNRILD